MRGGLEGIYERDLWKVYQRFWGWFTPRLRLLTQLFLFLAAFPAMILRICVIASTLYIWEVEQVSFRVRFQLITSVVLEGVVLGMTFNAIKISLNIRVELMDLT